MQDDISYFNTLGLLDLLLADKTTGANILWATDDYQSYGEGFHAKDTMSLDALLSHPQILQPRKQKAAEHQSARTREHAEVFTPSWMCRKMNDIADTELKASFPEENAYIKARVLEITCGEAPFLTGRYDVVTGEAIPVEKRTGLLDRKLMVVDRLATDEHGWMPLALCALQSTYGYEWQGDSLLLARINIARSFSDHLEHTSGRQPTLAEWRKVLHVIAWNVWQMDGLTGTVPLSEPEPVDGQLDLFAMPERKSTTPLCRTYDWRSNRSVVYSGKGSRHMKFDFIIGNPPYNEDFENSGDNGKFAKPIYNDFMDEAYQIADKVELIHPARFLFNAGSTPKEWNQKMLNNPHFKILQYEPDSAKVFPPPVDIKGGVAISLYNKEINYKPIKVFTAFPELNGILRKVTNTSTQFVNSIISGRGVYKLSPLAIKEHPELETIQSKGHTTDVGTGAFKLLDNIIYFIVKPEDNQKNWVQILGLLSNKREYRWCRRDYLQCPDSFTKYKVFLPNSNGSGALGEVLSTPLIGEPLIGEPLIGATETFLSIGCFDTKEEAQACLKYVKSKFARVMLGILKTTQHNTRECWKFVPLQDFTSHSDIDWSKSVHEIDLQLYKKYGLSAEEISFIETHVKEMA